MKKTKKMIISALFIALGVALPIAMHSIPNAGSIFLPMHIPVLMCGLVCGPVYGLACGLMTPFLSSLLTGMPPMAYLPSMLCELAVYGLVAGILVSTVKTKSRTLNLYIALLGSMLCGRVVFGLLNAVIFKAGAYSLQLWITAAFVKALPGIITQLLAIPAVILILDKTGLLND